MKNTERIHAGIELYILNRSLPRSYCERGILCTGTLGSFKIEAYILKYTDCIRLSAKAVRPAGAGYWPLFIINIARSVTKYISSLKYLLQKKRKVLQI